MSPKCMHFKLTLTLKPVRTVITGKVSAALRREKLIKSSFCSLLMFFRERIKIASSCIQLLQHVAAFSSSNRHYRVNSQYIRTRVWRS
jgi:hypothetical protein